MKNNIKDFSTIELQMELHRRQAESIKAQGKPDLNREYARIQSAELRNGRVEIRMSDGRQISLCADGPYNHNRIKVLYHSHEWDWSNCYFDNYQYPQD